MVSRVLVRSSLLILFVGGLLLTQQPAVLAQSGGSPKREQLPNGYTGKVSVSYVDASGVSKTDVLLAKNCDELSSQLQNKLHQYTLEECASTLNYNQADPAKSTLTFHFILSANETGTTDFLTKYSVSNLQCQSIKDKSSSSTFYTKTTGYDYRLPTKPIDYDYFINSSQSPQVFQPTSSDAAMFVGTSTANSVNVQFKKSYSTSCELPVGTLPNFSCEKIDYDVEAAITKALLKSSYKQEVFGRSFTSDHQAWPKLTAKAYPAGPDPSCNNYRFEGSNELSWKVKTYKAVTASAVPLPDLQINTAAGKIERVNQDGSQQLFSLADTSPITIGAETRSLEFSAISVKNVGRTNAMGSVAFALYLHQAPSGIISRIAHKIVSINLAPGSSLNDLTVSVDMSEESLLAETMKNLPANSYPLLDFAIDIEDVPALLAEAANGGSIKEFEEYSNNVSEVRPPLIYALPDLVPDLSQAKFIALENGKTYQSLPIRLSSDTEKIELKNMIIANRGISKFEGDTTLKLTITAGSESATSEIIYPLPRLSLKPGETTSLNLVIYKKIPAPEATYVDLLVDLPSLLKDNKTVFNFLVDVDAYGHIVQSNNENDRAEVSGFLLSNMLIVTVLDNTSQQRPLSGVVVTATRTSNTTDSRQAITDKDGQALFPILGPVRLQSIDYGIRVTVGATEIAPRGKVTITGYQVFRHQVEQSVGGLIITPSLQKEVDVGEDDSVATFLPTEGIIKITPSLNSSTVLSASIKNGSAFFSTATQSNFTAGQYYLLPSKAAVRYEIPAILDQPPSTDTVSFIWPEPSRTSELGQDKNSPPNWTVRSTSELTKVDFNMLLKKRCQKDAELSITLCIYDDAAHITTTVSTLLPRIKPVLLRMKSWRTYPVPSSLNRLVIYPDYANGVIAFFHSGIANAIFIENRKLLLSPDNTGFVLTHESFHLLDHNYRDGSGDRASEYPPYEQSVRNQLESQIGQTLWDNTAMDCAYNSACMDGYHAENLSDPLGSFLFSETLAEEKTVTCLYRQRVFDRLRNIEQYWSEKVGPLSSAERAELLKYRDETLKRLTGQFEADKAAEPRFSNWNQQCLTD